MRCCWFWESCGVTTLVGVAIRNGSKWLVFIATENVSRQRSARQAPATVLAGRPGTLSTPENPERNRSWGLKGFASLPPNKMAGRLLRVAIGPPTVLAGRNDAISSPDSAEENRFWSLRGLAFAAFGDPPSVVFGESTLGLGGASLSAVLSSRRPARDRRGRREPAGWGDSLNVAFAAFGLRSGQAPRVRSG
jgi:hypothetical protein